MKLNLYDIIIIGLGPAGMTAGIYCARKGLKTLILGKAVGGQVSKTNLIENYLGFGQVTALELVSKFDRHVEGFKNLEHMHDILVKKLSRENKAFKVLTDKGYFMAKAIIICSGRKPRELKVPGEIEYRAKGVSYCEVCDAPLFKGKNTAVIGGGNSALQAALALAPLCPKVYIININKNLNADKIILEKIRKIKNIIIKNSAKTAAILGDKFVTGISYLDLRNGKIKKINLEGVFIEIGWEPEINFDNITQKDKYNQIIITKKCQTSVSGIFAAGDVTDVGFNQIIVAAGEGAKAALSASEYLSKNV